MASPEERAAAADPSTDLTELARLAHEHPDLRPVVAGNSSAYEGLLEWLGAIGDPAVNAALAARGAAPVAAAGGWHEPAREVPLQWGTYDIRYGLGLGMLLLALVLRYVLPLPVLQPLVPALLSFVALAIVPSTLGRRLGAGGIVVAAILPLALLGGGFGYGFSIPGAILFGGIAMTACPLLIWLILRMRIGLSYLLVIGAIILGSAAALLGSLASYAIGIAVLAGLAWAARAIHKRRAPMLAQASAAQQAAFAAAYPQGGYVQPGYAPMPVAQAYAGGPVIARPGAPTNTTAVLALVFGIGGGLLGIILGHTARAQIRRTGEAGWGLATAGLVFGYIGLGIGVVFGIIYVVLLTR